MTGWLNDHVNPESDVVVDDSLSISGAAADAAKVGELKSATNDLNTDFSDVSGISKNISSSIFGFGDIYVNSGELTFGPATQARVRNKENLYFHLGAKSIVKLKDYSVARFKMFFTDSSVVKSNKYVNSSWITSEEWVAPYECDCYITLARPSGYSPADIANVSDVSDDLIIINTLSDISERLGVADYKRKINIIADESCIEGNDFTTWQNGAYNGSGVWSKSMYRVCCTGDITIQRDTTIIVDDDYRIDVVIKRSGDLYPLGWVTGRLALPKGTVCIITIAKVSENTSSIADVNEFAKALLIKFAKPHTKNWVSCLHAGNNTLAYFYNGYLNGAEMIECDACLANRSNHDDQYQYTKDDLILWHDNVVTDVNGDTYDIRTTAPSVLKDVVVDNNSIYGAQTLATLEEVLNLAYNTGMLVGIDIKNGKYASNVVANTVVECGMKGKVVYAINGGASGMEKISARINVINGILEIDPLAKFVDSMAHWTIGEDDEGQIITTTAIFDAFDNYKEIFYSYAETYNSTNIDPIIESGCRLLLTGVGKDSSHELEDATAWYPEVIEFYDNTNINQLEDAYFSNLALY